MTDEELTAALSELDEVRETAERELESARASEEALDCLERDKDTLMESYAGMVREALEDLAPDERYRIHKLLRLGVHFRPDWHLEITGVFSEVGDEAASSDLSPCKLAPGSFPGDELVALKFSAQLTEGGSERLELLRA